MIRIFTGTGVIEEYAGDSTTDYATLPRFTHYLIGKSALELERMFTWDRVEKHRTGVVEYP